MLHGRILAHLNCSVSSSWSVVRKVLERLWVVYSSPVPQSFGELLALLLICLVIAAATGGMLYHWLSGALRYGGAWSGAAAGVCCAAVFLLSALVHPFRCSLTLVLPGLGTRQGRRLLVSSCAMLLLLHVLPNVASNVASFSRLLRCTSENLVRTMIDSSDLLSSIKAEVVREAAKVDAAQGNFVQKLRDFDQSVQINLTEVRERFRSVSNGVEQNFRLVKINLEGAKLAASRFMAAVFVLYLLFDSVCYLKSYLTSVKFDNVYITGQLRRMAALNGTRIEEREVKHGVNSTGCKMSRRELWRLLGPVALVSLYCAVGILLVALDYGVYHLVRAAEPWLEDVPSTLVNITVVFKVGWSLDSLCLFQSAFSQDCPEFTAVDFHRLYNCTLGPGSRRCRVDPTEPSPGVVLLLGLVYLLSYGAALLEVYARRLRRKVAASFFRQQEERRMEFLFKKILARRTRGQDGVYFIETAHWEQGGGTGAIGPVAPPRPRPDAGR